MQDYCPMCLKLGAKMKIKLLQINLQEAVRICESEKCAWPFGYEDFIFYPRTVGKLWSCYWEDYKSESSNTKESIPVPTGLSLPTSNCNPEVDTSEEKISSCLNTDFMQNTLAQNTSPIKSSLETYPFTSTCRDPGKPSPNGHSEQGTRNFLSKLQLVNNSELKNDLELLRDTIKKADMTEDVCTKGKKNSGLRTVGSNNCISSIEGKSDSLTKSAKNTLDSQSDKNTNTCNTRSVPKITSIEKTNINISNVVIDNQISSPPDSDSTSYNERKGIGRTNETVRTFESPESQPSMNVTTMEIDGLPPITLSYELPANAANPRPVTGNIQEIKSKTGSIKNSTKRNVTSGRKYEKFSFNAIKKKIESESHNGIANNSRPSDKQLDVKENGVGNNLLNSADSEDVNNKSNLAISEENVATDSLLNQANSSVTTNNLSSGLSISSQDSSTVNSAVNIDTVLNEFWTNDCNVSEDINDDWLDSLLS